MSNAFSQKLTNQLLNTWFAKIISSKIPNTHGHAESICMAHEICQRKFGRVKGALVWFTNFSTKTTHVKISQLVDKLPKSSLMKNTHVKTHMWNTCGIGTITCVSHMIHMWITCELKHMWITCELKHMWITCDCSNSTGEPHVFHMCVFTCVFFVRVMFALLL